MKFKEERSIINTSQNLIQFNASGPISLKMEANKIMAHTCPYKWHSKLISMVTVSRTLAQKGITMM